MQANLLACAKIIGYIFLCGCEKMSFSSHVIYQLFKPKWRVVYPWIIPGTMEFATLYKKKTHKFSIHSLFFFFFCYLLAKCRTHPFSKSYSSLFLS